MKKSWRMGLGAGICPTPRLHLTRVIAGGGMTVRSLAGHRGRRSGLALSQAAAGCSASALAFGGRAAVFWATESARTVGWQMRPLERQVAKTGPAALKRSNTIAARRAHRARRGTSRAAPVARRHLGAGGQAVCAWQMSGGHQSRT